MEMVYRLAMDTSLTNCGLKCMCHTWNYHRPCVSSPKVTTIHPFHCQSTTPNLTVCTHLCMSMWFASFLLLGRRFYSTIKFQKQQWRPNRRGQMRRGQGPSDESNGETRYDEQWMHKGSQLGRVQVKWYDFASLCHNSLNNSVNWR